MKIIYLHGFLSSPQSYKSQVIGGVVAALSQDRLRGQLSYYAPQLPDLVSKADSFVRQLCEDELKAGERIALCGSSLGGLLALRSAFFYELRCCVINPLLLRPGAKPLENMRGTVVQNPYTGRKIIVTDEELDLLYELSCFRQFRPGKIKAFISSGDEVVDPALTAEIFCKCGLDYALLRGGNHDFFEIDRYAASLLDFLLIEPAPHPQKEVVWGHGEDN